ncbi:MAG: NUDIX hydrolase [Flavobacteriia bacterium]|nr:MAG: NUDIX hydrolase [Flavobacteriia bacterium]
MKKNQNDFLKNLESQIKQSIPGHSVDCVIVGYKNYELQVLMVKQFSTDKWALPGGFIYKDEDLNDAATRVLKERTGVEYSFLEQFYTFGKYKRRDIDQVLDDLRKGKLNSPFTEEWFKQRFISTAFLALVDINQCDIKAGLYSDDCDWKPVSGLAELMFDHNQIVDKAIEKIKKQLDYLPIGKALLPKQFTMNDLQRLYESILQKKLDRGNFQKKILKLDVLIRKEKFYSGGAHKAPYLYEFDDEKYKRLLEEGIAFL